MPKGTGFVDYQTFEEAYETLKRQTRSFADVSASTLAAAVSTSPLAFIVVRAVLGFTPPEWAYVATQKTGTLVTQGFARTLDRAVRRAPRKPLSLATMSNEAFEALLRAASAMLSESVASVEASKIHRLSKADTQDGVHSLQAVATLGVPYAMLLYERFLGRPFAGHRDSVSELIGGGMENAIEEILVKAGVSYTKTKRAQRVPGFDQAPDFIIPDQYSPRVVIEAKITEDDGTARDKVTRVQHLRQLSLAGAVGDEPKFEVVACIGGRGFGVRKEDMRKLIEATRGKVFTTKTLDRLVDCTGIREYVSIRG